jgi:hypothetical protein
LLACAEADRLLVADGAARIGGALALPETDGIVGRACLIRPALPGRVRPVAACIGCRAIACKPHVTVVRAGPCTQIAARLAAEAGAAVRLPAAARHDLA